MFYLVSWVVGLSCCEVEVIIDNGLEGEFSLVVSGYTIRSEKDIRMLMD